MIPILSGATSAASTLAGRLEEGGTLRLEARAVPGGRLVLEGGGDAVGKDARDRVVRAKERAIPFRREGLEPLWVTAEPLLPGSYDGTVEPDGVPVRFEVRAGEETRVPFAVAAADAEAASRRKGP